LTSAQIGKAIGRSRRAVDFYIADLRAVIQQELDFKLFRMLTAHRLGIPQDRIAKRLGVDQKTISNHLGKKAELPYLLKADLSKGFTVSQMAQKHGWTEPMVWALALEGKKDLERFKQLNWGLRAWDQWDFNDCDHRFGDDWPGRIPAQLVAHTLYYFSREGDLVFDPMGGGGVTPDVCLAFHRRCWTLDMEDRPDSRPEIEPYYWDRQGKNLPGILKAREMYRNTKKTNRLAFINADWRDFQNKPAVDENRKDAIFLDHYLKLLNKTGWFHTHLIQSPLSSERFHAAV